MVPNGAAYNNYPPFGTNGTKTPPGGSTESAKYALGMVPADTFPAEWANYLFYGATQGITRLNQDTGSIKKEINTVLACKNITPDATACDQLYCALLKIRDDAVALAYPVGTVYMNAKCATLPDALQAIGTWCAIDGRFLRACSACIGCTDGNASVTLSVCNLPVHCHTMVHCHGYTPSGSVANHCHTIPNHCHSGTVKVLTALSVSGSGSTGGMSANEGGYFRISRSYCGCGGDYGGNISTENFSNTACKWQLATSASYEKTLLCFKVAHTHSVSVTGSASGGSFTFTGCGMCLGTGVTALYSGACQPGFTGSCKNTDSTFCCSSSRCKEPLPNTGNVGSGCSFSILPPYRDVAMWYRDA